MLSLCGVGVQTQPNCLTSLFLMALNQVLLFFYGHGLGLAHGKAFLEHPWLVWLQAGYAAAPLCPFPGMASTFSSRVLFFIDLRLISLGFGAIAGHRCVGLWGGAGVAAVLLLDGGGICYGALVAVIICTGTEHRLTFCNCRGEASARAQVSACGRGLALPCFNAFCLIACDTRDSHSWPDPLSKTLPQPLAN